MDSDVSDDVIAIAKVVGGKFRGTKVAVLKTDWQGQTLGAKQTFTTWKDVMQFPPGRNRPYENAPVRFLEAKDEHPRGE